MISARVDFQGPLFERAADRILRRVLRAKVSALTGLVRARVVEKAPVGATGALRSSIQEEIEERGDEVIGYVLTNLDYALPVEFGSRPHFPPIEPLEYWARRKLQLSAAEAENVAWRVARKISQKGTEGHHMFEHGLKEGERMASKVSKDIALEVTRDLGG